MLHTQIKLPKFLGIGAAKCGTTSLHEILAQHSEIYLPEKKELHFFENDAHYNLGLNWYADYFKEVNDKKLIGEITADYIFYNYVPERIFKDLGKDVKLILMLRNPVDRAYSEYLFNVRRGYLNSSFEEVIENEKNFDPDKFENRNCVPIYRSKYSVHIKRFLNYFDSNNIHYVLFEDDFIANRTETFNNIFSFLNVPREDINLNQRYKPAYVPKYQWLQSIVYQPNRLKNFSKKFLKTHKLRRRIKDQLLPLINKSKNEVEKITPQLRNNLMQQYFIEDIKETEKLINRDLESWLSATALMDGETE
jgi:Sulfotransferase domain